MSGPFCENPECLFKHTQAEDDQLEKEVILPMNEGSFKIERGRMVYKNGGSMSLCYSCKNAIDMIQEAPVAGESVKYVSKQFCENKKCWLSLVECDPDQMEITLQVPDGSSAFASARNDFVFPSGKKKRLCKACSHSVRIHITPELWPERTSPIAMPEHEGLVLPKDMH